MAATKRRREPFGKVEPFKVKARRPAVRQSSSGRYAGPGTAKMREEFEGTLAAERREAEAKATRAEVRRDAQPNRPRGSSKVAVGRKATGAGSSLSRSLNRRARSFLRLGTANPRRVIVLELVGTLVVLTVDQLAAGEVPAPSNYVAAFVVYLVLGFVAEVGGDGGARVATGLGALVLVALVLANGPGIVKALNVATGQRGRRAQSAEGVG